MTKYLVLDVGCVRCGEDPSVIGVFNTESEAKTAADVARENRLDDWQDHHFVYVLPVEVPDE